MAAFQEPTSQPWNQEIEKSAWKHYGNKHNKKWIVPYPITLILVTYFGLDVDHLASPFDSVEHLPYFYTYHEPDEQIGALNLATIRKKSLNGYFAPGSDDNDIKKSIRAAISTNSALSLLILPFTDPVHYTPLQLICSWQEGRFSISYTEHNTQLE